MFFLSFPLTPFFLGRPIVPLDWWDSSVFWWISWTIWTPASHWSKGGDGKMMWEMGRFAIFFRCDFSVLGHGNVWRSEYIHILLSGHIRSSCKKCWRCGKSGRQCPMWRNRKTWNQHNVSHTGPWWVGLVESNLHHICLQWRYPAKWCEPLHWICIQWAGKLQPWFLGFLLMNSSSACTYI